MKIGVSSYSFAKYMKQTGCGYFEIVPLAKELGFDAIEFLEISGDDPVATAKQLKQRCSEVGLEISAYTVGANLLKGDREETVKHLMLCADVAAALGAPVMRHDICSALPEGMDWEEGMREMVPMIRRITAYAKEKGVRTCSENHGRIYQDSVRVERVIREVNDENYRWLVDVGNFLCVDEDPVDAVRRALPYAIHVHVKDFLYRKVDELAVLPEGFFKTRNGNLLRGTILGHGDVPVVECLELFKEAGYNGVCSLEFEGAEENMDALRLSLAYLKRVAE